MKQPASTKVEEVEAIWLSCPLGVQQKHVSDFGRIDRFDAVLVRVVAEDGTIGLGEAKSAVGSKGECGGLLATIRDDLRPLLRGRDSREIRRLWNRMYCGSRSDLAEERGRGFPALGRRGTRIAAISGVDLALWDLLGKRLDCSVLELIGGPCRESLTAYGSGGWGPAAAIGAELKGYVDQGMHAVKMRIGAMDRSLAASVERVHAAREALGPEVLLMADAHGTLTVPQAKRFCDEVKRDDLRFLEEPVAIDDPRGLAEVRHACGIPIAAGESESTAFDFLELLRRDAIDVAQPDLAICGGLTEGLKIAALVSAHSKELAPHCWGSAISFQAGLTLAFATESATLMEWPMGGAPLLREMCVQDLSPRGGRFLPPAGPGFGIDMRSGFVESVEFRGRPDSPEGRSGG